MDPEILVPQARATAVYRRLLDWIDRADRASQLPGAPRPDFLATDGGRIFPDESETWWLLDRTRQAKEDKDLDAGGDEDGPFSNQDGQTNDDADGMVTDSSAGSDHNDIKIGQVAWGRSETMKVTTMPTPEQVCADLRAKTPAEQPSYGTNNKRKLKTTS